MASGLIAGAAMAALAGAALQPAQADTPIDGPGKQRPAHVKKHDRPGPKTKEQRRETRKALELLESGSRTLSQRAQGGATVKLKNGRYVEFPVNRTDKVLTMLGEFGTESNPEHGTDPGPSHNEIPRPDRRVDNSTYWVDDFGKAHYDEMFNGRGESFRNFYKEASSGRYDVSVTTEDWVEVPGNASSYGDNAVEDDGGSWAFIADTADAWYDAQVAAGRTPAQIDDYLAQFDVWDRYDYDNDGDFNEADGYIDHFQAVHAGGGEEAGAGDDAIWSHRWYVNGDLYGQTGPVVGGEQNLYGGAQVGESRYFIGDYTVEPENGGLGVFVHEYGHDLELPDFYDTAGGDNGTGFWSVMSSGSWLGHGDGAIGTTPGGFGPEEKLYLGWLDYTEVDAGERGTFELSPSQKTMKRHDQAIKVNLPDKTTVRDYTTPPEGEHAWWSGRGDSLVNTLTREVPAAASVEVGADIWHQIEAGYDFLYVEYSLDGGSSWTNLAKLDGNADWTSHSWSYAPGGAASTLRIRYNTDGGVNEAGAFLDNITVTTDGTTFTDGAEDGDNGWAVDGFTVSTGTDTKTTERYYLIENRQYVGYDGTLEVGPYNFGKGVTRPDWVEHFPYQEGMLVWLVDEAWADNNTSAHEGEGYALPVDVRPDSLTFPDGTSPTNRREPFDATFSLSRTDRVCLHKEVSTDDGVQRLAACSPRQRGIATFDDSDPERYWTETNPWNSVKVAGVGVTARVVDEDRDGTITVRVRNP
ncbi:immune inhibitor A domain-containing protein [Nocardioides caeni]|uniref:M6 family metalloprotease domain-containing protein n=1 Tax=Nocardioides caeni TaxID=574700 RepID=A0A4S8NMR8_9ACTN|nr:immune inhibitor A domain-containing protein [Nocardioides caeni]THV18273.1 M6 family metalloprotease domain-containing protein [Nocardioides caeni]